MPCKSAGSSSKTALSSIAQDTREPSLSPQCVLPCHGAVLIFKGHVENRDTDKPGFRVRKCGIILTTGSQCLAVVPPPPQVPAFPLWRLESLGALAELEKVGLCGTRKFNDCMGLGKSTEPCLISLDWEKFPSYPPFPPSAPWRRTSKSAQVMPPSSRWRMRAERWPGQ